MVFHLVKGKKKVKRPSLKSVTLDSYKVTDKIVALGAHSLPSFLCQCSLLQLFKAKATQIRRKSNQTLESPKIEPGTSGSEGVSTRIALG